MHDLDGKIVLLRQLFDHNDHYTFFLTPINPIRNGSRTLHPIFQDEMDTPSMMSHLFAMDGFSNHLQDLPLIKRLGEDGQCTGMGRSHSHRICKISCNHHSRRTTHRRTRNNFKELASIHMWHLEISDDEINRFFLT